MLKIPTWLMYFSLVLAFGLIFLIQAVTLVEKIMAFGKKDEEVDS